MRIPHPIPYQGSKRGIAEAILAYFPQHVTRLVEPFAGSAAVTLATAAHYRADRFWLNDLNEPLMRLWDAIIYHPEQIADAYEHLWKEQQGRERQYYDLIRDEFNRTHRPEYLLYLLARCVKASVRYNANGEFNQSPDNRRRGMHPITMRRQIMEASRLLRDKTLITALGYQSVLSDVSSNDLVYMDPPYQGVCAGRDPRYYTNINHDDLYQWLRQLNARGVPYLLSYDGRNDLRTYGRPLPADINLVRVEIYAGRSSQATLLGIKAYTVESLYLSPSLIERIGAGRIENVGNQHNQYALFELK
ncbi:MAG: DNA adenine methylase [Armatimonadota bacterium]|nr:DNA adenine methylase [bacterium]MDW8319962.1 DNA adenine methylase [Armatimonadota bacterium]